MPAMAVAKPTDDVKFICNQYPVNINVKAFPADSETLAVLQAEDYFNNGTGYKNKGCRVTAVRKIFN